MKKTSLSLFLLLFCPLIYAQRTYQASDANLKAREWFQDAKFGMFIHWGPSSILGAGEWVMNNRNIHRDNYRHLADFFNPIEFDAHEWVKTAKNAGMKYITLITRHHDSFSLWDSKVTDWDIMNSPYHKDIVKALAEECHKQGIKLFLYYSILDWYRTDYQYKTGRTGQGTGRTVQGDWDEYIQFMKDQLTELLTQYGSIGGIWLDGHWDQVQWNEETKKWIGKSKVDWHYDEIYPLIHRLQPHALIGNNHHLPPFPGEDFQMFERDLPGQNTTGWGTDTSHVSQLPLETCQTINGSWGYNITDTSYKSTKELIHFLIKAAGNNANLLLNIGPMPNGEIQGEFKKRLDAVGNWLNKYGESIYGTRGGYLKPQDWGAMTRKGNVIYLHILNPETTTITLPGFKGKIKSISRMATNSPIEYHKKKDTLQINCGELPSDKIDEVLIITLKE